MATQTDLWGDLGIAALRSPVTILREQASLLGEKTRNLIVAEVFTATLGNGFTHAFNLVVPALNDYTYQLFAIRHGIDLYPVNVDGDELATEQQFIQWLQATLSSEKTKKILASLLSQVAK